MAEIASVTFDLIDELVASFTEALPEVIVIDGDAVVNDIGTFLYVGWDDPDNTRSTSANSTQPWVGLGGLHQDETGTVTCYVVRTVGDPVTKDARDAVRSVADTVKATLRADPNLGGRVPGLRWARFGQRFELTQWLSQNGAVALCSFEIAFEARI